MIGAKVIQSSGNNRVHIVRYDGSSAEAWRSIVVVADNGHFMFDRAYMDYHEDRFDDCSFLVYRDQHLIGVVPGNIRGEAWCSHGGLTFGGLLLLPKFNRISVVKEVYDMLFSTLLGQGVKAALVKPVPWIYHRVPAEGEIYALNAIADARCLTEVTTTVDLKANEKPSSLRLRGRKRALKAGFSVVQSNDFSSFWKILSARLQEKYERMPVHSCEEIILLAARFPKQIKLFLVNDDQGIPQGGTVIFETETVAHAQYISATPDGMNNGALDLLFLEVIEQYRNIGKRYFDFGISTENDGKYLNEQLASFKEGFGGRSGVHHKFEIGL